MSDDTIKRSDAIDAVIKAEIRASIYYKPNWDMVKKFIADIPSVDRPQGTWIDISEWYAPRQKCSICETVVDGYGSNFCPNCGADMREVHNE